MPRYGITWCAVAWRGVACQTCNDSKPQKLGAQLKKTRVADRDRWFSNCSMTVDRSYVPNFPVDIDFGVMEPKSPSNAAG
jgi:hypothetical protein